MKMTGWKRFELSLIAFAALSGCASAGNADAAAIPVASEAMPMLDMVDVPSRSLLTNNPGAGELGLNVGATYTANPPYGNPPDPNNNRLIDSDKPVADWNTTTGINGTDQTVTFDLQKKHKLDEAALLFDDPRKPASVTVSVANAADGPWREVSILRLEEQADPWWRLPLKDVEGRFVRFDFKLKEWGWYLREVKIYSASSTSAGATLKRNNELVLADKTGAHSAIVLANRAHAGALDAAMLFQKVAQRMTGVLLPIVPSSKLDAKTTAIFIGDSQAARKRGVRVEQTPFGDDRYTLRTGDNWLALVGNDARPNREFKQGMKQFRGSVYAVYDFFERRGCGWYGPDALWQVVPQVPSLTASRLNVSEVPAFTMRDQWMYPLDSPQLRDAWRLGGMYVQVNHMYDYLVPPDKYKKDHPEWFGEGQPDITHPEVIRIAVATVGANLDARPDEPLVTFPVGANDNGGFKDPPFKNVGNNAAQQLYFANEIAKGLRASHPNRKFILGMYGYWFSHDGPSPMLKGEPEVHIFLVNEGNHAKPLDFPETPEIARTTARNNTRELAAITNWKKTGRLTGIYEWWIPVLANPVWKEVPWYDGDTAIRNLRLWHREGIREMYYESQGETNAGFPLRWAQYYVAARGMWDPKIDPHGVLREACGKLYGPAANAMTNFYELQQTAMRETTERGGNWALPAPHLLYTTQIEARGDALLTQAEKALEKTAPADKRRARVAAERKMWRRLKEINATTRETAAKTYTVTLDGKKLEFTGAKIDAAMVRNLFGLPEDTALEAVEFDGQNHAALAGETFDLQTGITFRTLPKP